MKTESVNAKNQLDEEILNGPGTISFQFKPVKYGPHTVYQLNIEIDNSDGMLEYDPSYPPYFHGNLNNSPEPNGEDYVRVVVKDRSTPSTDKSPLKFGNIGMYKKATSPNEGVILLIVKDSNGVEKERKKRRTAVKVTSSGGGTNG